MATHPIGGPGPQSLNDAPTRTSTDRTDGTRSTQDPSKVPANGAEGAPAGAEATEKVQISQKARDLLRMSELMNSARNTLDKTPDVRAERIAEVKERMRAGVYETDGVRQELAHRLSGILGELPASGPGGSQAE
ncbi:MAG TPA: flagellar biosynthesis anti-sigma factor FlgM [Candidatus Krumholzibacteria bacterium]|nr:flagellar biosynthesis anti-sigma factor FlgM [Candidatus Krumholzibacteria bacterium]